MPKKTESKKTESKKTELKTNKEFEPAGIEIFLEISKALFTFAARTKRPEIIFLQQGRETRYDHDKRRWAQMVYLRDISAILGVSVSTVSKALKGYPDISEETRRRVIRTAEDIGYRGSADRDRRAHDWSDQSLETAINERRCKTDQKDVRGRYTDEIGLNTGDTGQYTGAIGVLAPDMGNLLESARYREILCAMAAEAVMHDRDLVILGADIRKAAEKGLAGICLLAKEEQPADEDVTDLNECGIPIVGIGKETAENADEAGRAAVRKLLRIAERSEQK